MSQSNIDMLVFRTAGIVPTRHTRTTTQQFALWIARIAGKSGSAVAFAGSCTGLTYRYRSDAREMWSMPQSTGGFQPDKPPPGSLAGSASLDYDH